MKFNGKRIIVTGGAQGIGEAAVRAFTKAGAQVVSTDLNKDLGEKVVAEASSAGSGRAWFHEIDVANGASVEQAFEFADDTLGGLDALVNIAGIQRSAFAADITEDIFHKIYNINVLGTIHTNQQAHHRMVRNGGSIINVGSMAGFVPELSNAVYGSSKAAVHALVRAFSREWGPEGVRVNAILPYVNTPMFDKYRNSLSPEELAAYDKSVADAIPLGRVGDAESDLAPAILFLASDDARFITGQLLPVDGGLANVR